MSEKQLEKLYYSIYPMNQCETQSKSYEETKELCETLEKEMISLMSPDLQAMFEDYKEYTLNLKQTEQRDAYICLLYTSPSPRDISGSRMPSSA